MRGGKSSVEWRGARFGIVALAAGALTASVLEAQEVSRGRDGSTEEGPPLDVLVGMRGELVELFSPGANLDVAVRFPDSAAWASMGFPAQMIRWNVQYDHRTRRDHQHLGRVRRDTRTRWQLLDVCQSSILIDRPSNRRPIASLSRYGCVSGVASMKASGSPA